MRTLFVALLVAAQGAFAGEADVVDVKVRRASAGAYDFDVTVKSVHKGWDHYADAFEVRARHKPKRYDGQTMRVALPR